MLPQISLTPLLGEATSVTLVLVDYSKYSVSERTSYHFLLSGALSNSAEEINQHESQFEREGEQTIKNSHDICGVQQLLECVPTKVRLSRFERRALRMAIQRFNQAAVVENQRFCHEPSQLPLSFNPSTRVFFAYQRTRIALLIDAAPTLVATYGSINKGQKSGATCPLDNITRMVRTYVESLVEPILHHDTKNAWEPELSISVMAVFPSSDHSDVPSTSLLVRDYTLTNKESANKLVRQLETWLLSTVEEELATRMSRKHQSLLFADLTSPVQQSSVRDWLETGNAALSTVSERI